MGKRRNRWVYNCSDYGQSIFNETISYSRTLYEIKNNLKGMGLYGGHTIMSHCGVTLDGLKNRLVGQDADAYESTSYQTYDDCINAISYGLSSTWSSTVVPWLKDSDGSKFLTINCELPKDIIGYGVCSDDLNTLKYCHTQCIVLKRSPKNKWGFTIKTAFPTYKAISSIKRYESELIW